MSDLVTGRRPSKASANRAVENPSQRLRIDWVIHAGDWSAFEPFDQHIMQIAAALSGSGRDLPATDCEVALALSDDAAVQVLNRDFRQFDKPTNVLSFPAAPITSRMAGAYFLGDVILASETVLHESQDRKLEPNHHLIHLIIHGILHLLGYDHKNAAEARIMEKIEIQLLSGLGISDPYSENVSQ